MPEMGAYVNARKSDEVVGIDVRWFMDHLSEFVDKKENTPKWMGIWIKSLFGMNEIIIADPTIATDILKDNKIVDKNSGLGKLVFHPRL
jgi:hypothetical protein